MRLINRYPGYCLTVVSAIILVNSAAAYGQDLVDPAGKLLQCRQIKAPDERLRCFDAAAVIMKSALDSGRIAVVDPKASDAQGAEAKAFSGQSRQAPEPFRQIETQIQSAMPGPDGNWIVVLKAGGIWRQIDGVALSRSPKHDDAVTVMRAALGSYKMRIAGQSAVRVRRVQ